MTLSKKDLVIIRNGKESDKNFIMATFLRGFYYGDSWAREIPKDIFMSVYHAVVEKLLAAPGILIQVACLREDADVILGYSIIGANVAGLTLHWVFVKAAWRNIGIGKSLVPEGKVNAATHLTKSGLSILRKHPEVVYNPFLI